MRATSKSQAAVGIGGRIFGTLFFGVFLAVGLGLTGLFGHTIWKGLRPWFWPEIPCVIVASSVTQVGKDEEPRAEIRYRYEVPGGPAVISDRIQEGGIFTSSSGDVSAAYSLTYRFPPDRQTICYVNPKDRNEAVLIRTSPWSALMIFFPLIFVAVGGGGVVFSWSSKAKSDASRALSKKVNAQPTGCVRGFFLLFFVIGASVLIPFFLRPVGKILIAQSWPATPCTILKSGVYTSKSSDGDTYRVDVHYRYQVGGYPFASNTYSFTGGSTSSGYAGKQQIASRYRPGMESVCYVNPKDPVEAVLDRGWVNDLWFGLIPGVFCLVGLIGFFAIGRTTSKRPPTGLPRKMHIEERRSPSGSGSVVLKTSGTPLGKFIGLFIFTIFWSGVIALMIWKDAPIFLTIIFGAFDALLLVGLGHQFLALFNPRPTVSVNSAILPLGSELEVEWTFQGSVRRIHRLRIFLRGQEVATYRRGTSNYTDRHVFEELPLCEESDPGAIATGRARLVLPTDTIHSFESSNNKIEWSLHVKGEIPRWPDVDEEFPVTILPLPPAAHFDPR